MKTILTSLLVLFAIATGYAQPGPSSDYQLDHYEHLFDGSSKPELMAFDGKLMPNPLTDTVIKGVTFHAFRAVRPATRDRFTVLVTDEVLKLVNENWESGNATEFYGTNRGKFWTFSQYVGPAEIKQDGTVVFSRQGDELTVKERKELEKRRKKELRKSNGGNKGYGRRNGQQAVPANTTPTGQPGSNCAPATQQRQRKPIVWGVQATGGASTPIGNVMVTTGVGDNGDGDGIDVNVGGVLQNQWGSIGAGGTNEPGMQGGGNGLMINGQQPINGMLNPNNLPPVLDGNCANCYLIP